MTFLRWVLVLPAIVAAVFLGRLLGWLSWEFLDLLPLVPESWDSAGIELFRALYCPFAVVSAGMFVAPRFRLVVGIVLAVLYVAFAVFTIRVVPNQWLHGIPTLVVSIIFSGVSVPATMDALAPEDARNT